MSSVCGALVGLLTLVGLRVGFLILNLDGFLVGRAVGSGSTKVS